ncbi:MAG: 1,4-dihydroxy-6-naphthoate synthase [Saprospiraceae bacterium]|nr:1,4-dihydroxy-6-naphthoate synthase [Saprospiraceae bacterium]
MKLTLGFSPCPNDTYIFDAMVHGKIDTEGLEFEVLLADVEELNQKAFKGELDITKLSYHAYAYLTDTYILLKAGSALGHQCGPLLIARKPLTIREVNQARIAIPGKFTTANFLLGLAYPEAKQKEEVLFSEIEQKVIQGEVDAGLIIHENRFTYQDKGLVKIVDLGEYWETSTRLPIPLGGIVVNRALPLTIQQKVNRVMFKSVAYAFQNPESSKEFVRAHAQEMDEKVMYQHINLYVNEYTRVLGDKGENAVNQMFTLAKAKGLIPLFNKDLFLA